MSTKVTVTFILPSKSKLCTEPRVRRHLSSALSRAWTQEAKPADAQFDKQLHEACQLATITVETCKDEEEDE